MIIVFSGGLGNQMFQYAFYLAKKKTASDVYISIPIQLEEKRREEKEFTMVLNWIDYTALNPKNHLYGYE